MTISSSTKDRFLSMVCIQSNGCWIWQGRLYDGYGKFYVKELKTVVEAHRAGWLIFRGPIPKGILVCHNCPDGDIKACVNMDHMFLGSRKEHGADTRAKGQYRVCERNPVAKLTRADVTALCKEYQSGESLRKLKIKYGTSSVAAIVSGQSWRAVTGGEDLRVGRRDPSDKLDWAKVAEIRKLYAAGGVTYTSLAKRYGTALETVRLVILGRTWKSGACVAPKP